MVRALTSLAMLAMTLSLAGCSLDLGEAPFRCCAGKDCRPKCPDGYYCKSDYCVKEGSCPDFVPGCEAAVGCNRNGSCDPGENDKNCPEDCFIEADCGNGTCDAGETPQSCPADCAPGADCGNGTCDAGETPQSCPADCAPGADCGNGTCDAGETPQSCPADCQASECAADETQCVGASSVRYCEKGSWKTGTCDALCKEGPYDYSVGCEQDETTKKDLCICGVFGTLGSLCSDVAPCAPDHICGQFDPAKPGFCTKLCTTAEAVCSGSPSGTQARCILKMTSGSLACGFSCAGAANCPQGLACDALDQLCKPK